jgi:NADH-quinone oxidoreductase subunit N
MSSVWAFFPLAAVVLGALAVLLLEAFIPRERKEYLGFVAMAFLAASALLALGAWSRGRSYFLGALTFDRLAVYLTVLFCLAVALVILLTLRYMAEQDANHGEIFALLLFALSGMMIMTSTQNLLVMFLGLEVLSISCYALAGMRRRDEKSGEAALKYFLLGSFASAFLVLGLAFVFGTAGSLEVAAVIRAFSLGGPSVLGILGVALVVVGFGFKIAVVPFHMWTPDVYEGAPTPVTAFFSVGPKAAGLVVFVRIFLNFWRTGAASSPVFSALWLMSALTMIVANLIALRQTNVKRLLAYSSIAHAGYILVAVLAGDPVSLVFYLTAYVFMNVGAFAALVGLSRRGQEYLELDDFAGVGFKYPWLGGTLAVFLLSLAGFPPTAGFLAKFYVFSAAVRRGLLPLVVIGVLASLVSVFYYLRIIVTMYMREPARRVEIEAENPAVFLVLFFCLYGVIQLGVFPGNVLAAIRQAVSALPIL